MKKYLYFAMTALMISVIACEKENGNNSSLENSEKESQANWIVLRANGNETESKSEINDGGYFTWTASTDMIAVHANDGTYKISEKASVDGSEADFSVDLGANTRDAFCVFPASIVAPSATNYGQENKPLDITLPASYHKAQVEGTFSPIPMIATNNGEYLHFKQLAALLRLTVHNIPATTSYITLDFNGKKVSGEFSAQDDHSGDTHSVTPGTATIQTSDDGDHDMITIDELGISTYTESLTFNVPVPTGTFNKLTVTAFDEGGNVLLTMSRPIKKGNANWSADRRVARKVRAALPSFSVSDSKRVVIARSNLKCTTEDGWDSWSWSFMENPWTVVESSMPSTNYAGATTIGLFGWGTSGHEFYPTYYGDQYKPNMTTYYNAPEGDDKSKTVTAAKHYGPGIGKDLTGDTYKYGDWGIEIGVCRDQAIDGYKTWRTPTKAEYSYLLGLKNSGGQGDALKTAFATKEDTPDYRYPRREKCFGLGTVEGRKGLIVVPDFFADPSGNFIGGYYSDATTISYTAEEWLVMSEAGAVFLPATGVRTNSFNVENSLYQIRYWTSTHKDEVSCQIYHLNVNANNVRIVDENASSGRAVRLIREID